MKNQYVALSHHQEKREFHRFGQNQKMILTENYGTVRIPYSGTICSLIRYVYIIFVR